MQMRPIVDRLQAEFGDTVAFSFLNAGREGQETFRALALPGHPSYVVFTADSAEVYRSFGIVEENRLRQAILQAKGE